MSLHPTFAFTHTHTRAGFSGLFVPLFLCERFGQRFKPDSIRHGGERKLQRKTITHFTFYNEKFDSISFNRSPDCLHQTGCIFVRTAMAHQLTNLRVRRLQRTAVLCIISRQFVLAEMVVHFVVSLSVLRHPSPVCPRCALVAIINND